LSWKADFSLGTVVLWAISFALIYACMLMISSSNLMNILAIAASQNSGEDKTIREGYTYLLGA
jgi:hypothetical protein